MFSDLHSINRARLQLRQHDFNGAYSSYPLDNMGVPLSNPWWWLLELFRIDGRNSLYERQPEHISLYYSPDITANHYQRLIYSALSISGVDYAPIAQNQIANLPAKLIKPDTVVIFHQHWLKDIYTDFDSEISDYYSVDLYFNHLRNFHSLGGKIIWTVHNLFDHDITNSEHRHLNQHCLCQMMQLADLILIHSPDSQTALEAICHLDISDRVHVLPHPLYDSMLSLQQNCPTELDGHELFDGLTYLCFGLLRPYKGGLDLLLDYLAALQSGHLENSRLIFAGIVRDKSLLREHAQLPDSLRHKIIFINRRISDHELAWLCSNSDIAVLPYREILTSGSFYQATTFALPAIVPASGMFTSLVKDGEDALVYKLDSDLSTSLKRAYNLGQPALKRLGENALLRHRKSSASEHVSTRFLELLFQLVRSAPSAILDERDESSVRLATILSEDSHRSKSSLLEIFLDLGSLSPFEKLCWIGWCNLLIQGCGRQVQLVLFEPDLDDSAIKKNEISALTQGCSVRLMKTKTNILITSGNHVHISSSMTLSDKLLHRFDLILVHPSSLPSIWATDIFFRLTGESDWVDALCSALVDATDERWRCQLDEWLAKVAPAGFRASVLTSIHDGSEFLQGFLEDVANWISYSQYEHFLIRADSQGNEHADLLDHVRQHDNAVYINLVQDPGLYAVWNLGARLSSAEYLTNANLDDRRAPEHLSTLVDYLEEHPDISVVSTQLRVTTQPNLAWAGSDDSALLFKSKEIACYAADRLFIRDSSGVRSYNLPHCMPVWRRSLHLHAGFFREKRFGPSADWAFWSGAGLLGFRFAFLASPMGLYLRHAESYWRRKSAQDFDQRIVAEYADMALQGIRLSRDDFTLRQRIDETLAAYRDGDSLGILSGLLDCALRLLHLDLVDSNISASRELIDLMAKRWLGMPEFVLFVDLRQKILRDMNTPLNNIANFIIELLHEYPELELESSTRFHACIERAMLDYFMMTRSILPLLALAYLRHRQNRFAEEARLLFLASKHAPQTFQAEKDTVYLRKPVLEMPSAPAI